MENTNSGWRKRSGKDEKRLERRTWSAATIAKVITKAKMKVKKVFMFQEGRIDSTIIMLSIVFVSFVNCFL